MQAATPRPDLFELINAVATVRVNMIVVFIVINSIILMISMITWYKNICPTLSFYLGGVAHPSHHAYSGSKQPIFLESPNFKVSAEVVKEIIEVTKVIYDFYNAKFCSFS